MSDIRLITKDTDLSSIGDPYDWDVYIQGEPYYVIKVPGYVHTIVGPRGLNDLWAYPRNQKPTYENLIQYNSDSVIHWGIRYQEDIQIHTRWGRTKAEDIKSVTITRNNKPFYIIHGNMGTAIDEARAAIDSFNMHPLNIHMIDFDKKMIGRKVWYEAQAAKIAEYEMGYVTLVPDGREQFESDHLPVTSVRISILSDCVRWLRE